MKTTIQRAMFAVAVATFGAGAVATASAQSASSAPAATTPAKGRHHGHHHFGGSRFVGTLLRATKQLNLSASQKESIKSIMAASRPAHQAGAVEQGPGLTVLGNPGDPNYAAAIQNEQSRSATRIQKETALAGQIYGVLSSAQKTQLPTVLAAMQAKEQAHRAEWAAKHAANSNS